MKQPSKFAAIPIFVTGLAIFALTVYVMFFSTELDIPEMKSVSKIIIGMIGGLVGGGLLFLACQVWQKGLSRS